MVSPNTAPAGVDQFIDDGMKRFATRPELGSGAAPMPRTVRRRHRHAARAAMPRLILAAIRCRVRSA
jgi:hypothetical protein